MCVCGERLQWSKEMSLCLFLVILVRETKGRDYGWKIKRLMEDLEISNQTCIMKRWGNPPPPGGGGPVGCGGGGGWWGGSFGGS